MLWDDDEFIDEPVYEDTDESGLPLENKRPKYTKASTVFQKRMLSVCGRKYFKAGEKGKVIAIERTMIPLTTSLKSKLPAEWVEHCIKYAIKLNAEYTKMTLPNLVKYINNESKKTDWVANYIRINKVKIHKRMDDDDDGLVEVNFE